MSVKYSVQQMGRSSPIKRPKCDYSNQVSDWRSQDKQEKHKVPGPEEEPDADTPGADQLPKDDAIKFQQGLNQSCFGGPLLTKMLIG